jgi:hypothetical protein
MFFSVAKFGKVFSNHWKYMVEPKEVRSEGRSGGHATVAHELSNQNMYLTYLLIIIRLHIAVWEMRPSFQGRLQLK